MNKLMIAAAVAAISAGAFASGSKAQVYDAKITVKTTVCKEARVAAGYLTQVLGYERGETISYRKQASRTILGILWGCGCDEAFSGEWGVANEKDDGTQYWYGNLFWYKDTGTWLGETFDATVADFSEEGFINRIGKKATEVEMFWTLAIDPAADDSGTEAGKLNNAGFGTITDSIGLDEAGDIVTCDSVIKSAKGNTAGFLPAPGGESNECEYCQIGEGCEAWEFCTCEDAEFFKPDFTAASGSWTIKYNSAASKRLSSRAKITLAGVKTLPKDLLAELVAAGE